MLGRVLDALEKSPQRDNTIVVLWSDHGWHLGEKEHWQKYTGWRQCTRVPLMIRVPKGTPGLPAGTAAGTRCGQAVCLTDLFRTLTELCAVPASQTPDSSTLSLVPLLQDPNREWPHAAITQLDKPDTYSVSRGTWRYIHYPDGGEELYDIAQDPYEHKNLLHGTAAAEHTARAAELRAFAPKDPAPIKEIPLASLTALKWTPASAGATPPSKPDGTPFEIRFVNSRSQPVELLQLTPAGAAESFGTIEPQKLKSQQAIPGTVWEIRTPGGTRLGYFTIGDRTAKAIVPEDK
jgi:hypothetical protein